jgi:hypothetical protein
MKFFTIAALLAGLVVGPATAQDTSIIDLAMQALGEAGIPPRTCSTQANPSCSYTQICSDLSEQRNSAYLYENAAGERIPNFNYQALASLVMQCGRQKGLYEKPSTASTSGLLDFARWLVDQPAELQVKLNRIDLAYADAAYGQTLSARLAGESSADYQNRQYREAAQRARIPLDEVLQEAIDRKVASQLAMASASVQSASQIDWDKVPPRVRTVMQDPFLNPEILSQDSPVGSSARAQFQERSSEIATLANEVRAQTLQVLQDQKARYPERAEALEGMSVRLRTAAVSFVVNPQEIKSECPSPNAFYDPLEHTLKICPQMMGMPKEHLRMVIGHELGHSVDPCGASCPLHVVSADGQTQYSIADLSTLLAGIPGVGTAVAATGVTYPENPFREVLSCLATPESLNARLAEPIRARALLEEQLRIERASGLSTEKTEQLLAQLPRLMSDYAGCSILPGNSRQQEAFADWLAAEAVAVAGTATNLTEVGGMFYAVDCAGVTPDLATEIMPILQQNNCVSSGEQGGLEDLLPDVYLAGIYLGQLQEGQDDSHPATVDRINRLFRLQPKLREKMGCGPQEMSGSYCAP